MVMNFTPSTVGSLFYRLGQLGGIADFGRTYFRDDGQAIVDNRTLIEAYAGTGVSITGDINKEEDISDKMRSAFDRFREGSWLSYMGELKTSALLTLRRHVWRDTNTFSKSSLSSETTKDDLRELFRQMVAQSATVTACTITLTSATGSTNTGNGALVTSTKRSDGRVNELAMAETLRLRCDEDSFVPAGIKGYERWTGIGQESVNGFHPNWGETGYGSGARAPFRTINPEAWATNGNMLINGFETFPSSGSVNTPTGWATDGAGVDATDFLKSTAQKYFGSNSLQWVAGTSVNTVLAQYFNRYNETNSTSEKLLGSTQYAVIVRLLHTGTITGGVLTAELTDSANAVTADNLYTETAGVRGTQNTGTVNVATELPVANTWYTFVFVFRSPKNVLAGTKLRLRLSTVLTGADLFMDSVAMGRMTHAYTGGPALAIFGGSTPWVKDDFFTVAVANNNGGVAHARKNYHRLADAAWDLHANDILLNTAGTGSIADAGNIA